MSKRNDRSLKLPPGTPVLSMNDPNFADQLREAIGAGPGERIQIVTPQFERPKNDPPPASPPTDWSALRQMNRKALKEIGLRAWDEPDTEGRVLMLLPGEWYTQIPEGFDLVCINGESEKFKRGETDDDIRFGCLAYGIRVLS